jgi:hypothetical protein
MIISKMSVNSQGTTRKDNWATEAEITLSAFLAFSMILLSIFPQAGRILCIISAGLFILFYSAQGYRLLIKIIHTDTTSAYDWINYFVAIVALAIIAVNILWLGNSLIPALITLMLLLLIMFLNFHQKRIDTIRKDHYAIKQIRLIVLLVITFILIFTSIH